MRLKRPFQFLRLRPKFTSASLFGVEGSGRCVVSREVFPLLELVLGWLIGSTSRGRPVQKVERVAPSTESVRPVIISRQAPAIDLTNGRERCDFPVVGATFHQETLIAMFGKYTRAGLTGHCGAEFTRDLNNSHDVNAIKVAIRGQTVGYFSRDEAQYLVEWMRANNVNKEYVFKCTAYLSGGSRSNQHDLIPYYVKINYKRPKKISTD